ncbi:MAG: Vi polysaccharide biosynthesis UDP-N-acetylglucosamine C-6 dehydrogenase TviB, partial [Cycloclasticus sp.]|nr:Vi polysaccharide biosynthesis UDP-N-acetylglucosamine C-6 dehydrogenase TviB [Cycloclasticus sp.]
MDFNIAVIGLGYVGLPLAVEFARQYPTIGFDIDKERIAALNDGKDATLEVSSDELSKVDRLRFTTNLADIGRANIYIITVPTPIDNGNNPNLTPIKEATKTVAASLCKGDIVIYESTVYPGATEE